MTADSLPVLLRRICAANGWSEFPAREAGAWFRSIADELGLSEARVSDCARKLGLWNYLSGSPEMSPPIARPTEAEARERLGEWLTAGLAETGRAR